MRETLMNWRERAQTANMGRRVLAVVLGVMIMSSALLAGPTALSELGGPDVSPVGTASAGAGDVAFTVNNIPGDKVIVTKDGTIVVGDTANNRIIGFNQDGTEIFNKTTNHTFVDLEADYTTGYFVTEGDAAWAEVWASDGTKQREIEGVSGDIASMFIGNGVLVAGDQDNEKTVSLTTGNIIASTTVGKRYDFGGDVGPNRISGTGDNQRATFADHNLNVISSASDQSYTLKSINNLDQVLSVGRINTGDISDVDDSDALRVWDDQANELYNDSDALNNNAFAEDRYGSYIAFAQNSTPIHVWDGESQTMVTGSTPTTQISGLEAASDKFVYWSDSTATVMDYSPTEIYSYTPGGSINDIALDPTTGNAAVKTTNTLYFVNSRQTETVSGTVNSQDGQPIENATVLAEEEAVSNTTLSDGSYSLELPNGTHTLTASKDGFKDSSITVEVNGSNVTNANITLAYESNESIILDTRSLIKHNESHPYTVRELIQEGDRNISYTVTDNATVTSLNTTLLTVDESTNTLNATADENVSGVVVVKAEYNGSISYTNVTVAQPTVDNLEIVPGIWRVQAVVGDDFYFFLLLATLMAVPVARFTSAFGGLAIGEMILVVGWLGGYVGFGMAAVSVFISLFIGLNLAANINYTAGRFDRG